MSNYRALNQVEIDQLSVNGNRAVDWKMIEVLDGFSANNIWFSEFVGDVRIAQNVKISFATIESSVVGSNVTIKNIGGRIKQCRINEGAIVEDVAEVAYDDLKAGRVFSAAAVLVETGGREVDLLPNLSAQTAYLQAFSTSHEFKVCFEKMVDKETKNYSESYCCIGENAVIKNCGRILNSNIGANVELLGVTEAIGSTINGSVGAGSLVKNSTIAQNGRVGINCILDNCFIADGALVDLGFSAENSLFFANSDCMRGEACGVFAAPYTSSHHKSTLLLTAIYSFYTAGSGSNFSNHRFKLGPLHQGVIERGAKSGSSSYMLWPSKVAPFTSVIGKHAKVVDSSLFPFSLLIKEDSRSILLPGSLLFSSGYERDTMKWIDRDKRSPESLDVINVQPLTPYTVGKIIAAIEALKLMQDGIVPEELIGVEVPVDYIHKSLARYHAGVNFYYGNVVASMLEKYHTNSERVASYCMEKSCAGEWVDLAGLIAPFGLVQKVISDVTDKKITSYSDLLLAIKRLGSNYEQYEWEWVLSKIGELNFGDPTNNGVLERVITNWRKAAELRLELVKRDAHKEFTSNMKIGYGLLDDRNADFKAVRGEFADNRFIKCVEEETRDIVARSDLLLAKILL